ncbi:hypothetical protein HPB48_027130 [Haemaphysalis longicornis]|uniref:Uncharacterized protein n=1 Tax=Haemaphysalis longicornis TaxID=44386 RepID=A0A9J6HBG4_HAELO|nr:hypothetical protein HPB48_027130 [Haemaphysalis longicornis]
MDSRPVTTSDIAQASAHGKAMLDRLESTPATTRKTAPFTEPAGASVHSSIPSIKVVRARVAQNSTSSTNSSPLVVHLQRAPQYSATARIVCLILHPRLIKVLFRDGPQPTVPDTLPCPEEVTECCNLPVTIEGDFDAHMEEFDRNADRMGRVRHDCVECTRLRDVGWVFVRTHEDPEEWLQVALQEVGKGRNAKRRRAILSRVHSKTLAGAPRCRASRSCSTSREREREEEVHELPHPRPQQQGRRAVPDLCARFTVLLGARGTAKPRCSKRHSGTQETSEQERLGRLFPVHHVSNSAHKRHVTGD